MEEETANTTVEDQVDGSGSSPDENNLEDLSQEELIDLVRREKEAKQEAIRHMREQEAKRKLQEEETAAAQQDQSTTEEPDESDDDSDDVRKLIREEARKIVQEEQLEARYKEFSKGSTDWLKQQTWASSLFGDGEESDRLFAKYSKELARLSKEEPVSTVDDYRKHMAMAVVSVTKKPDALLTISADEDIASDKSQAGGYRGSSITQTTVNYSGLSDAERYMINRANELRAAQGKPPLKQKDIFKK